MRSRALPFSTLSTSYTVLPFSVSFAVPRMVACGYACLNAVVTGAGN